MIITIGGSSVNTSTPSLYPSSFITRRSGVRISRDFQPPSAVWKRPAGKKQPHTRVENTFWSEGVARKLKPIPSAVYLYLRSLADENAQCWPSPRRISREVGASDKSVRRALKLLEQCGLINIGECFHEGTDENATNLYTLLPLSSFRDPHQVDLTVSQVVPTSEALVGSHRPPNKNHGVSEQETNNKVRTTQKSQRVAVEPLAAQSVVASENPLSNGTQTKPPSFDLCEQLVDAKLVENLVQQVLAVGVKPEAKARSLVVSTTPEKLRLQLDCLPDRGANNPAALLVAAVKGNFDPPRAYTERMERKLGEQREKEARAHQEALLIQQREEKARRAKEEEKQHLELDAIWKSLDKRNQEKVEAEAKARVGLLAELRPSSVAVDVERRNILRERLNLGEVLQPEEVTLSRVSLPAPTTLPEVTPVVPAEMVVEMAEREKVTFSSPSSSRVEAIVWSRLEADDVGIEDVDDLRDTVGNSLEDEEWEVLKASVLKRWKKRLG